MTLSNLVATVLPGHTRSSDHNFTKHSAIPLVCVMDHVSVYRLTAQGMQDAMNRHLAEGREI